MIATLGKYGDKIELDLGRHFILNTIRSAIQKNHGEFGKDDVVVACDSRKYWRKDVFPYYKGKRGSDRDASNIDWDGIFEVQRVVKAELAEFFPYKVIEVLGAEADDIIGTLVHTCAPQGDRILLIGDDKDFYQLHSHMTFHQYDPVFRKKRVVCPNGDQYLKEQIFRGDGGDGIPNVLSDDDTFMVPGKRQKQLREVKLKEYLAVEPEKLPPEVYRNYKRNQQLIDLSYTPTEIKEKILKDYKQQHGKDRSKLMKYFMDNRLRNLLESIGDF